MVKLSLEICLSNKMMFLPLHKISLVTFLHSSILFLQINKKYHSLQTFALHGHFNSQFKYLHTRPSFSSFVK